MVCVLFVMRCVLCEAVRFGVVCGLCLCVCPCFNMCVVCDVLFMLCVVCVRVVVI